MSALDGSKEGNGRMITEGEDHDAETYECALNGIWSIGIPQNPDEGIMMPLATEDHAIVRQALRIAAASSDMIEALQAGLKYEGGWREAIAELEDHCSEPVRLKNMIAALDQLDFWADKARSALEKAGINGEHMKDRGS